ncbi:DMT family transporter [Flavobacteriaceae bacterium]|nr:DMT family transporter [Flavobacteriaceae bacterium]
MFGNEKLKWIFLGILALVWGSSFILMKKALLGLTSIEIGAFRTLFTSVFLLIIGGRKIKLIRKDQWKYIAISALIGTFIPAFFFAIAIDHIDSSIAAVLNSLTPLGTLVFGFMFFGFAFRSKALLGVVVGLIGTLLLILKGADLNPNQNYWFASLIIISTVGYAFNVNIIKKYLYDLNALSITAGNFVLLIIPAILVLIFSDYSYQKSQLPAFGYLIILAVIGTGIAKIIFNRLVQIANPVFASSVTYLIPVVALAWGALDGEKIHVQQLIAAGIILFGVYLTNWFMKS